MLLQMRSFTRSWVSYVLLFILAALFVLFLGNGQSVLADIQFARSNSVAEVGGRSITAAQLSREMDIALRQERDRGNNVTQADAIQAGIHMRLLDSLIGRNAFAAYAQKIGVSASDLQVAQQIRSIPPAQNPVTGAFDQAAFANFLNQLGYSQADFTEELRGEHTSQMLMEALASGVRAPSSFGALLLSFQNETRVVSVAEAPAAAVGAVAPPTTAELETFYQESQAQLQVPEYRALTMVYARPADFVARVDIPEERLRQEFDARREALTQPERRTYVRITTSSEAQANDAAARWARGEAPAAIAAALGAQTSRGESQARTDVPDARVAEAVFATAPNSAPLVVHGDLGPWAVVRVEAVTPAVEPDFAAMRGEIRDAIAHDEATDLLNAAVSAFDEARASGASVADAASQNGLAVVRIPAVDAQGHDPAGQPVAALADKRDLLRAAGRTGEGEASDFIPDGDADVVVSVDRITPVSVRPLDSVRSQLNEAWIARERVRRLRALADEVVAAVNGGQDFATVARAHRMNMVVRSLAANRQEAGQIPARGLAGQIFAAREGTAVSDLRSDGQAMLVAVVEHINRIDAAASPQEVETMRAQLQQGLTGSFGEAVQAQIVARGKPHRNEQLINQAFPREAADDAQQ